MRWDLTVPKSWSELSQDQLRYVFTITVTAQNAMAPMRFMSRDDYSAQLFASIAARCLFKWTSLELIGLLDGGKVLVGYLGSEGIMDHTELVAAYEALAWMRELPTEPVRLERIDEAEAVPADLSSDFSFKAWLACENLWQGYQLTQDDELLRQMAEWLYNKPGLQADAAERLSIFYWWAAVKTMVSKMFPSFFRPTEVDCAEPVTPDSLRRGMDAQIRALTKGDITKEKEILGLDAIRALTELDAQAREYEELNKKYGKH